MKTTYLDQFEKYYNREMTDEEKLSFENSLSANPELDAAFREYLSVYEAIGDRETMDLRMKLKELRDQKKIKNSKSDFLSHGYNWMWLAALITIMVGFTIITSLIITKPTAKEKYANELIIQSKQNLSDLDRELIRFGIRQVDFRIDYPRDSVFIEREKPLTFKWYVNEPDPLILELIDWDGNIVFSSRGPVKSPYTIEETLPAGILVYRFRTQTDAFRLGFIYLR